jgi:predicted acetyltransferase
MPPPITLVWPADRYLESYAQALQAGWSPNNLRPEARFDELEKIAEDPQAFLKELVDVEGLGAPVKMPDGSTVQKLPGYRKWLWNEADQEVCGSIGFRWQKGSNALPPHCLGHMGYSVLLAHRGKGYATEALRLLLLEAPAQGLTFIEITCDPRNLASRRVIEKNGGQFMGRFLSLPMLGGHEELKFRIEVGPIELKKATIA